MQKKQSLKRVLENKAVVFSLLNKSGNVLFGSINIFLISFFLSPEVQGFYYTFNSLILFQALIDIGFGTVLSQFVSHEFAFLQVSKSGLIEGEENHKERFVALVSIGKRWYKLLACLFLVIIGIAGSFVLLSNPQVNSKPYLLPWWILSLTTSLSMVLLPYRYIMDGMNQIAVSQKILFCGTLSGFLCSWISMYFGAGIYSLIVYSTINLIVTLLGVLRWAKLIHNIKPPKHSELLKFWKKDFLTQQWKIALTTISGFLMYQLFVPLLYKVSGPVAAGKMGATLQIFNAILVFGYLLPSLNAPKMGMLGAKKKYKEIMQLVNKLSLVATIAASIMVTLILMGFWGLQYFGYTKIIDRFIDFKWMAIFFITAIVMQRIATESFAVRFQKQEPYIVSSLVSSLISALLMYILAKKYSYQGEIIAFWIGTILIGLSWSHIIYNNFFKKKLNEPNHEMSNL